ncbi:hypothetical protein ACLEEJ_01085 [Lonsdalea quercina]|uniref:hypothetical protein n=1 Tax=Lonsdalea quercina TaxID=71657 RepID=UPI0039771E70
MKKLTKNIEKQSITLQQKNKSGILRSPFIRQKRHTNVMTDGRPASAAMMFEGIKRSGKRGNARPQDCLSDKEKSRDKEEIKAG